MHVSWGLTYPESTVAPENVYPSISMVIVYNYYKTMSLCLYVCNQNLCQFASYRL